MSPLVSTLLLHLSLLFMTLTLEETLVSVLEEVLHLEFLVSS